MGKYSDALLGDQPAAEQKQSYSSLLLDGPKAAATPQAAVPGHAIGLGRAGLQGATFGWADEAGAAASAALQPVVLGAMGLPYEEGFGNRYDQAMGEFQQEKTAYQEENPGKAAAAEVVGALGTGIASAPVKVLGTPMQAMSTIGKAGSLAATGAVQGGIYGAGAADQGERLGGAAKGAAIGAVAAPVIGAALKGVKSAAQYGAVKLSQTPRDQAVKAIRAAAEQEGLAADDAVRLLDDLGPEATLADLGENFRALARVAANKAGAAKVRAGAMVNARQAGQQSRLLGSAEQATGANADDFVSTVNRLTAQRSVKAKPLYDQAFAAQIDDQAPELAELLARPTMKSAMMQANKLAADAGDAIEPGNLMKRLHYAKMALDAKYEKLGPKEGTMKRAVLGLKNSLLEQMDSASPEYMEARKLYAGDSAMLGAADKGKNLFKADFDEMSEIVKGMSDSEKELFRLGSMRAIQDKMDTIPQTNDSVKRLLGQPRMQKLLGLVFDDPDGLQSFIKRAGAENEFARTRNVITGNSSTAAQLEGSQALSETIQPEVVTSLLRGDPVGAGLAGLSKILRKKEVSPQFLKELSDLLFEQGMNPQQVRQVIGSPPAIQQLARQSVVPYSVGSPAIMALSSQANKPTR